MFRPAGFSDSDSSEEEDQFSTLLSCNKTSYRRQFSDRDRRNVRDVDYSQTSGSSECTMTTIPWDTINNNEPAAAAMATSDFVISNPALVSVLERTKKYLRSTLLSHKGGVEVHELNQDYRELVGEGIPYTKLQFPSLEGLLRSLPTVCRIWQSTGIVMVEGVAGESSRHIQNMVAMQKPSGKGKSKKRCKGGRSSMFSMYGQSREMDSFHSRFADPPVQREKWGPVQTRELMQPLRKPVQSRETVQIYSLSQPVIVQPGAVTRDVTVFGNRVVDLMVGRVHGMYVGQLEKMYQKKFNESLPGDWTDVLAGGGKVIREVGSGGLTLVRCKEGGTVASVKVEQPTVVNNNMNDKAIIKKRVVGLLQGRVHGMFHSQVEKLYAKQWGESLEGEWWKELEQLGLVDVDRGEGQVVLKLRVMDTVSGIVESTGPKECGQDVDKLVDKINGLVVGGRSKMVERVRQMGRIKQLLQGRQHGLFMVQIKNLYQNQWEDDLDRRSVEEMEKAGSVELDRLETGQVVVRLKGCTGH